MNDLQVYSRLMAVQARTQFEYRRSFALSTVSSLLYSSFDLIALLIIFDNVHSLGSWQAPEVMVIYSVSSLSVAIVEIGMSGLDRLPVMTRQGTLDVYMTRPRPVLLQVLASEFQVHRAGRLLQASAVFVVVSFAYAPVRWDAAKILALLVTVVSGAVILGSLRLLASSVCLVVEGAAEFVNAFTAGAGFLAQYPLDIYSEWLRRLVLYVLPVGFVAYMPLSWILGKPDVADLGEFAQLAAPLAAVCIAAVALLFWSIVLRRYRSAGG